jgi:parallel beta-helix repeat protein
MRRITSLAITCAFLACISALSAASTVQVGSCLSGLVKFTTIQAAINSVPSGSTIKICPGNYREQLLITDSLILLGVAHAGSDAVVIYPPTAGLVQNTTDQRGAVAAQILVQSPTSTPISVSLSNLTVDGTGNNYNNDDLRGILYQDAGGTVNHVAVRNEIPGDVPTGIQSGQGIMVETTNFSGPATLNVLSSSVHNYNKNGILARYAGATLNATGNYVQGFGPTGVIGQNGIELAFGGAAGTIKSNTVIDNFYTGTDATASDILLYDASDTLGTVTVSGNTVGNSNIGIAIVAATVGTYGDFAAVSGNKVMASSLFDGIDVCSNNNTVTSNTIFNSTESGIHLDASCGTTGSNNSVKGNTILESACAGILQDPGTTNTIGTNTYYTVPTLVAASCPAPAALARVRTVNRFKP